MCDSVSPSSLMGCGKGLDCTKWHMQEGVAAFSSLTRLQSLRLYEISGLNDEGVVSAVSSLTRCTWPGSGQKLQLK